MARTQCGPDGHASSSHITDRWGIHGRVVLQWFRSIAVTALFAMLLAASPAAADNHEDSAVFELKLDVSWSPAATPFEFPDGAHLTLVLAVTHHSRYVLFKDGNTASGGLELVAENGRISILKAELGEAMRRGRIDSIIEGDSLSGVPGQITLRVQAKKSHPLLSFVTMIAPSPDWFTGAANMPLLDGDRWIEQQDVFLWAWDAGTDSGTTFISPDMDTQPRESVRLVVTPHFLTKSGLVPLGRATLRRVRN